MITKHIGNGLKFEPIDWRREYVFEYMDGTELRIPKECTTRTGQLRAAITKAILLKQYNKLIEKGIIIRHHEKKGA